MEKIAAGQKAAKVINLDAPVKVNIQKTAKALNKKSRGCYGLRAGQTQA